MSCPKTCKCSDCEMCDTAHLLLVDDKSPNPFLDNPRYDVLGWHCMYHGGYAVEQEKLKVPQFRDDWIHTSENKTAERIIKKLFGV